MKRILIKPGGAVDCRAELPLKLPALSVWGQLRDFHRYVRQDYFHQSIEIAGELPRAGAQIRLRHSYFGLTVERVGRILWWREGVGFSYSDLSERGPRHGFPHVFSYRLRSIGPKSCVLEIHVRGRWTMKGLPRWAGRLWLRWVLSHIVIRVRNELMSYQIAHAARLSSTTCSISPK